MIDSCHFIWDVPNENVSTGIFGQRSLGLPAHPCSLIEAFTVGLQNNWILQSVRIESKSPDDTLRKRRMISYIKIKGQELTTLKWQWRFLTTLKWQCRFYICPVCPDKIHSGKYVSISSYFVTQDSRYPLIVALPGQFYSAFCVVLCIVLQKLKHN